MDIAVMIGVIQAVDAVGQVTPQLTGQQALMAAAELNMFRGAIVGALIVGLAFLSGLAVLKRGALAYCATFMVGTAAVLELFWLGFFPAPSSNLIVLLQGIFGASVIIFLSASVRLARKHTALGGVMFAASLVFVGVGIINFLGRADFSGAIIRGLVGVSIFTFGLAAFQAVRGDRGARMILPGALLGILATGIFVTGFANPLVGHGLLTFGLLTASMVALTERMGPTKKNSMKSPLGATTGGDADLFAYTDGVSPDRRKQSGNDMRASAARKVELANGRKPAISGERLVEVLDFAGLGVWDWSVDGVYQSASLCSMLGADCEANFTPEAMRAFVTPSHLALFEAEILGHGTGDGGFDTQIILHNDQVMRVRGARAVDNSGRLERVVAFFEIASINDHAAVTQGGDHAVAFSSQFGAAPNDILHSGVEPVHQQTTNIDIRLSAEPVRALATHETIGFDLTVINGPSHWKMTNWAEATLTKAADFLAQSHRDARAQHYGNAAPQGHFERAHIASDAFVSFAISYVELVQDGVIKSIRSAITRSGLPYGALVLELSDLDAITDIKAAKADLTALRQAGARLAFADANAGRAVLGNIHRYDFDTIKIDADVVGRAATDKAAQETIRTLVSLGRDLGLRVVAEGVQSSDQLNLVNAMGCAFAQGAAIAEQIQIVALEAGADRTAGKENEHTVPNFMHTPNEKQSSDDALSLDQWMSGSSDTRDTSNNNAPIRNLEAAFAESVPVFYPKDDPSAKRLANSDPDLKSEASLPKWRTWVKNMR